VLLLRKKDQEYSSPLASFATCLCRQRIGHERVRPCLQAKLYRSRSQISTWL